MKRLTFNLDDETVKVLNDFKTQGNPYALTIRQAVKAFKGINSTQNSTSYETPYEDTSWLEQERARKAKLKGLNLESNKLSEYIKSAPENKEGGSFLESIEPFDPYIDPYIDV